MSRKPPTGFRKKSNGYEFRFRIEGKRYSVFGSTIEECQEKRDTLREEIRKGLYTRNRDLTVAEYFEEFIKSKSGDVVEATIINNRATFERIGEAFGKRKIRTIEPREAASFREKLEKEIGDDQSKLTTRGANFILALLSAIFKAAVNDRIIEHNPAASLRRFKRVEEEAKNTIHRRLSPEELQAFFTASSESFYLHLFEFMLNTGVRVGEACALYWTDINFSTNEIKIERSITKTEKGRVKVGDSAKTEAGKRTIHMNEEIRRILHDQRNMTDMLFGSKVSGLVFPAARLDKNGEVAIARSTSIDTIMKELCKRSGIEHFTCHAFRHTFACACVDQGVAPEVLKSLMGHKDIRITLNVYYHDNSDRAREAMENVIVFRKAV